MTNDPTATAEVLNFLRQHNLMTICTQSAEGFPQAAMVEFATDDNLDLVFGTSQTSRKYNNLKNHPLVALTIGGYEESTVQYEGSAHEITADQAGEYDKKIAQRIRNNYFPLSQDKKLVYFRIQPRWIRFTDVSKSTWRTIEVNP